MLARLLALLVGFSGFVLYMAAFFFPEVHRKRDFLWSGVILFYALVLWVYGDRIRGGVLLGQIASVVILGWLGAQTLSMRRQLTPYDQQTWVEPAGKSLGERLFLRVEQWGDRLQTQLTRLPLPAPLQRRLSAAQPASTPTPAAPEAKPPKKAKAKPQSQTSDATDTQPATEPAAPTPAPSESDTPPSPATQPATPPTEEAVQSATPQSVEPEASASPPQPVSEDTVEMTQAADRADTIAASGEDAEDLPTPQPDPAPAATEPKEAAIANADEQPADYTESPAPVEAETAVTEAPESVADAETMTEEAISHSVAESGSEFTPETPDDSAISMADDEAAKAIAEEPDIPAEPEAIAANPAAVAPMADRPDEATAEPHSSATDDAPSEAPEIAATEAVEAEESGERQPESTEPARAEHANEAEDAIAETPDRASDTPSETPPETLPETLPENEEIALPSAPHSAPTPPIPQDEPSVASDDSAPHPSDDAAADDLAVPTEFLIGQEDWAMADWEPGEEIPSFRSAVDAIVAGLDDRARPSLSPEDSPSGSPDEADRLTAPASLGEADQEQTEAIPPDAPSDSAPEPDEWDTTERDDTLQDPWDDDWEAADTESATPVPTAMQPPDSPPPADAKPILPAVAEEQEDTWDMDWDSPPATPTPIEQPPIVPIVEPSLEPLDSPSLEEMFVGGDRYRASDEIVDVPAIDISDRPRRSTEWRDSPQKPQRRDRPRRPSQTDWGEPSPAPSRRPRRRPTPPPPPVEEMSNDDLFDDDDDWI